MSLYSGARSHGTSLGMRRWYMTMPRCRAWRKTYLVRIEYRKNGVCAKCQKKARQ